jgi:hypothetical protein
MYPYFDPAYPALGMIGYDDLRPCMAMTYGKHYLAVMWFPDSIAGVGTYRIYTYHLFHHHGGVFTTLYSEIPQNLSVSHPPTLTAGATSFPVSANDSSVIALTVNGEIIGVAEGTGSPVPITIPAQTPGNVMKVTVTKANYYRYEADVMVVSSNYPYVTLSADIIDDSAGNNDGVVNPGETIDYGVYGKNVGIGTAQSVYGLLTESAPDPYVTLTTDSAWYGDIAQDDSALSNPYYQLVVTTDCPNGHDINLTLNFHDINDSVFVSYPSLTVYAPVLTYQDHSVVGGNGNGILDPGETADLVVTIKNDGGAVAQNITSTLIESSPFITINDASGNFGTLDPGNTANNAADPYTVTASSSAPHGTNVDFQVEVVSGIYTDTLDFSLTIGLLVPSDTGYYYVYWSGGPHSQCPVFNWIAIDSTQSTYPGTSLNLGDDVVTQLNLPFTFTYYGLNYTQITVGSDGWIAMGFQTQYDQTNSAIPNTDGPSAMVAGLWDDLDPGNAGAPSDVYYYYDNTRNIFIVQWFECEHWPSGDYENFEIILYDPAYYPTPTGDGEIIVQYLNEQQQTDNTLGIENFSENVGIQYFYNGTYDALAVPVTDSFALKYTTYPPSWVGVEEQDKLSSIPRTTMFTGFHPNPFTRRTRISYQLATPGEVDLRVYDISGRLVRTLNQGLCDPGYYTVMWDGKDDRGRVVSSGVYFVRFETEGCEKVEKAVLLR